MATDLATRTRIGRLQTEALELARRYRSVSYDREDGTWFYIEKLAMPPGWNKQYVDILIDIPWGNPGYPSVAPQWFWTDQDLATSSGRSIQHFFTRGSSFADRQHLDKGWGHFCVHINQWRPAGGRNWQQGHSLISYLDLIKTIFRDRKRLAR